MKNQLAPVSNRIPEKKSTASLMHCSIPGIFAKRFLHSSSKGAERKIWCAVVIWLLMIAFSSCRKDVLDISGIEGLPLNVERDIYIAGYNNGKIVFWKNGVEHVLGTSEWSTGNALGILVSGNDVYVVGKRNNNAVYWKNGVEVPLTTDSTGTEEATAIAINGDDVYITGNESNGHGSSAVFWKNGVRNVLAHGADNKTLTSTRDILITGNDVYISGVIGNTAVYWKNGTKAVLSAETSAAYRMTASGADVFVCGMEKGSPVFWKNGVRTSLGAFSGCAYDVSASGEDIYLVGVENSLPTIWKNQVKTTLSSHFSDGMALGNCGIDTYVVGTMYDSMGCTATFWTNGIKTDLSLAPIPESGVTMANSIVIVSH